MNYELVDFGEGRKLERFGERVLDRPAPAAEGVSKADPAAWDQVAARFHRRTAQMGRWQCSTGASRTWLFHDDRAAFELRLTDSGQIGIFPEQADNWRWLQQQVTSSGRPIRVLNLFAYTGGATMFAAAAGAEVVHVDAARSILGWARCNAAHAGLDQAPIRWIPEGAVRFVDRELRRGRRYDGVILDPPTYGHGSGGEVWQIERDLPGLLRSAARLIQDGAPFLLLSCHSASYDTSSLRQLLADSLNVARGEVASGRLALHRTDGRILPSGLVAGWSGPA